MSDHRLLGALRGRYGSGGDEGDRFDPFVLVDTLRTHRAPLRAFTRDSDATLTLRPVDTVPDMSPLETLQLWFARFADEPGSARDLWSQGVTVHAVDGGFTGDFDDLLSWYAGKRDREGAGFSWHLQDLLGGGRYAAAIIRLVSDARPGGWDQHAIYEISQGKIRQVWLYES